jgi:hypothetical protein
MKPAPIPVTTRTRAASLPFSTSGVGRAPEQLVICRVSGPACADSPRSADRAWGRRRPLPGCAQNPPVGLRHQRVVGVITAVSWWGARRRGAPPRSILVCLARAAGDRGVGQRLVSCACRRSGPPGRPETTSEAGPIDVPGSPAHALVIGIGQRSPIAEPNDSESASAATASSVERMVGIRLRGRR